MLLVMFNSLRDTRSVSSVPFQVLSLRVVSCAPLRVSSPSLLSWLKCISSSWLNPHTPIDVYKHLYKLVCVIHLLRSIGDEDDGNFGIFKGVEGLGNTQ